MRDGLINLFSDTQTRPTEGMRRAIAAAEVGDEQRGEDPTVNRLCVRVAELLGFEAAMFLPSGTMCNQIAFQLHTRPGDEIVLHRTSHPIIAESGGPAALSGAMMQPLDGADGMFTADELRAALRRAGDRYQPRSRLVCVEQTANTAGGRIWPLGQLRAVIAAAREAGLKLHMDGSRLMNAVVATAVPAAEFTAGFDTVYLDFSKGLGAPVGACLAGSAELIEQGWRYKQMLGGAMRQAGVLAAAALYGLDHHVERLSEDHVNAQRLARGLADAGLPVLPVETNIVVFSVTADAYAFCGELERHGVVMNPIGPHRVRAMTHLDVDCDDMDRAVEAVRELQLVGVR